MRGTLTPENESAIAVQERCESSYVQCDPQLIEMAVHAAVRGAATEREFQDAREACYESAGSEARERAFVAVNQAWFARLRLASPILEVIEEFSYVSARTARCILAPAYRARDECAELYGHMPTPCADKPTLVIRLRPESFARPNEITGLLRHELMHISDMLDPAFGYDPSPQQFLHDDGVPTVLRDRYRALWDTYIDGRLVQEGRGAGISYERRRAEFCSVFKMLDPLNIPAFDKVFGAAELTHRHLLDFSRNPSAILELAVAAR